MSLSSIILQRTYRIYLYNAPGKLSGRLRNKDKPIFAPTLLVNVRNRITIKDINALTLELARKSKAKKEDGDDEPDKTHHTDIKMDATYADAEANILLYEERFGRKPQRFFADKIYMTKENHRKLKEMSIQCMRERLGRPHRVKS